MKYLQKTTLCLAAIVVVALGNKVTATTLDPSSVDQVDTNDYAGASLTVNDASGNGGSIILTDPEDATLSIVTGGVVKVGTFGGKTGTGATTVENGGILDITATTTDCIAGNVEVKSGGILQVDADIPASGGPFASGAGLTVRSGAILKLGAGKKWSKNLTIS
jgi:hypothetical protein